MHFFPSPSQWSRWSLPSKLTAIGAYLAVFGIILSIILFIVTKIDDKTPYIVNQLDSMRKDNPVVDPTITCVVNYDSHSEPTLVLINDGPIKVLYLTIDLIRAVYINELKMIFFSEPVPVLSGHFIQKAEFNPFETEYEEIGRMEYLYENQKYPKIDVFVLFLSYYREKDMKLYNNKIVYFIDENKVYTENEYKIEPHYKDILPHISKLETNNYWHNEERRQFLKHIELPR